jgi:quercetin dioxygenase-like cupin family protein
MSTTNETRLARLRELTETVTPYPALFGAPTKGLVALRVKGGSAYAVGLLKRPEVGVLDVHYEPHSEFPSHTHKEEEYVVVYSGHFFLDVSGTVVRLETNDMFRIGGGVVHKAWTEDDSCGQVVITIPANPEWPGPDAG